MARWSSRAAAVMPPKDPPLKEAAAFRLIGRPLKRLDTPDKANGNAQYGIDALPPGMKFATLAASPVLGGTVAHLDDAAAHARFPVCARSWCWTISWRSSAITCGPPSADSRRSRSRWNDGPNAGVSTELIWSRLRSASVRDGAVAKEVGDVGKALGAGESSSEVIAADYEMPLLAHACMEPMNCTVHVTPTSAEVWIGTQVMERVHAAVAKAAGLPESQVTVHNHLIGGGFGRRLEPDMA